MRYRALTVAFGVPAFVCSGHSASATPRVNVYVSLQGDDRFDGTKPVASNSARGPVKTILRAQRLARALLADRKSAVSIVIDPGTYFLDRPLLLSMADSGTSGAPTVIRARFPGTVRISGGVLLRQSTAYQTGRYEFNPSLFGGGCPSQLYINQTRRSRPRFPSKGYLTVAELQQESTAPPIASNRAIITLDERASLPTTALIGSQTEAVFLDAWTAPRFVISNYDRDSRTFSLVGTYSGHKGAKHPPSGTRVFFDNVFSSTLSPGEWSCDVNAGAITYLAQVGEQPRLLSAVAPKMPRLMIISGDAISKVHDINITGIEFSDTNWQTPIEGWAAMQAEVGQPAAIELYYCDKVTIDNVEIRETGAGGIKIGKGCQNVTVSNSIFRDIGGGGIFIGPEDRGTPSMQERLSSPSTSNQVSGIFVVGNRLTELGRVQIGSVGIWAGQVSDTTISNNHISNLYYSGISIGWVWNSSRGVAGRNKVLGNTVRDFGRGVLSDFGGIYTLGSQPNTVVSRNKIDGAVANDYGGWGIYADEGSSGIKFSDNTIGDVSHDAIFIHEVGDLIFDHNRSTRRGALIRCSLPREETNVSFSSNENLKLTKQCLKYKSSMSNE